MSQELYDQIVGALRILIPAVLAAMASAGWLAPEAVGEIGGYIINAAVALVALMSAGWSIWAHRAKGQIARTAKLPEVKTITVTDKNLADVELKDEPKVVASAG